MNEIFRKLHDCLAAGRDAVLVTIVASSGSTPRGAGARMLVTQGEKTIGTIGGGIVEHRSEQMALKALGDKSSFLEKFRLSKNEVADLGMICGGDVDVYFQYFSHSEPEAVNAVSGIIDALNKNEDCFLIIEYSENSWNMFLDKEGKKTDKEGKAYYVEHLVSVNRAVIFGGGHVAQKLSPVLRHIGFKHIILDDRAEFCNGDMFPMAEDTIVADLKNICKSVTITPHDYILIMTRGHLLDYDVLVQALRTDAAYIGMIGSRNKIAKTYENLYALGFEKKDTDRIYAPIGLEIMAETPEEISISIAAELIKVKAGFQKISV